MAWTEHVAWGAFALVGFVAFASARALDQRDDKLEARTKRPKARPRPRSDKDATERIVTQGGSKLPSGRPSMSSDRPSHSSDRPSHASDRPSHPSDRPMAPVERTSSPGERVSSPDGLTSTTSGESTRQAFDRSSLPPD